MRKRKVTPEPSLQARRQAERGTTVGDRCRTVTDRVKLALSGFWWSGP